MTPKMMKAPAPSTSSSEDHTLILQSHHNQLVRFNKALCQSTPEFSRCLFQLKCQPAPEWQLPQLPKQLSKHQPPVPDVVQEDKRPELVDTPLPKSSTNSTLLSTVLTQGVEEAVVKEVDHLLASLHPLSRLTTLWQAAGDNKGLKVKVIDEQDEMGKGKCHRHEMCSNKSTRSGDLYG